MIPRKHLLIMIGFVLVNAAFSAIYYPRLPDPCPIHWNLHGEVDGYGSPMTLTLIGPVSAAVLLLILAGLTQLGPFKSNIMEFRVTLGRMGVLIMALLLGLQVVIVLSASGAPIRIGAGLCVMIGLMFAIMGNWMGKLRRNLYIGIRTPWTVANDVVWERTHRLGGRLFVIAGLVTAVTGLLASEAVSGIVLLSTIGVSVAVVVAYSLILYRKLGQVDDLCPPTDSPSPRTEPKHEI
jgi:uncharacterized membrane protein